MSSIFPPVGLFDGVADPADLDVAFAVESLTNPRLRQETGELHLVPPEERISGAGTTPIMAAYTHLNPGGSRFSNGSYGVYYAATDMETAIAETIHHRERFLASTSQPATEVDMRCYLADIDDDFIDIRGEQSRSPELYEPDSYAASQAFAIGHRNAGARGIVYNSVRRPGGECVAPFWPKSISPARQGPHYAFVWDGASIRSYYEKSNLHNTNAP